MTLKQRPLGITLLAISLIINGLFGLLMSLYNTFSGASTLIGQALLWPLYWIVLLDVFIILLSVLTLVLGFGLWKMRRWGWLGALGREAIGILAVITVVVMDQTDQYGSRYGVLSSIGIIAFSLFIISYLLRPKVKAAFKRR